MIRPLGDTEDAARWWQAYRLAEDGRAGELRERAEAGDEHARQFLAEHPDWRQFLADPPG
ncbi:MAG TPA: hypothetical protein VKD66_20685 [Streptosporangiaceae bacterium]|nr:hypothetical protein [Streptosporangiaceae bacterium]